MSADDVSDEERLAAEALAGVLARGDLGAAGAPVLDGLVRSDVARAIDVAGVRRRVVGRARRRHVRVLVPASLALAAAAAVALATTRPPAAPLPMPEPDVALLEAQIRAAGERGLRTDLDVEAWRYRRRLFASLERRYTR